MAGQRSALLTIVRDEAFFFPIWHRYYARFFSPEDIYVLDHGSTDGSTSGGGFRRIPVEHEEIDVLWVRDTVQSYQHQLLAGYGAVLYVDVDEIVAPDPAWGTLGEYVDSFSGKIARCRGYEVIHLREAEPPFDAARPVLDQRRHWFANPMYSKPALARVPLQWTPGFHRCRGLTQDPDPNLFLIHLHRMDYDQCKARHRARASVPWAERNVRHGWWSQMLLDAEPEFGRWFYTDTVSDDHLPLCVEAIPPQFRSLI
ncbi:MAG TPA: hypothetical protein VHA57_08250 [Actinomycetota bacterium]|nr:hypothetical protein [Actinomycetota bacterium]